MRLSYLVKDQNCFLEKPKYDSECVLITDKSVEVSDILRCHDANYLLNLKKIRDKSIEYKCPVKLDSDTDIDPVIFEAAM